MVKKREQELLNLLNVAGTVSLVNSLDDPAGKKLMWNVSNYDSFIPLYDGEYIELSSEKCKPNGKLILSAEVLDIALDHKEGCRIIKLYYPGLREPVRLHTYSNIEGKLKMKYL